MMNTESGLRKGYTTGSCAAASAKASAYMLLLGKKTDKISIMTPAGYVFDTPVEDVGICEDAVSCAVRKDSGDDPDVTDKILIYAKVSKTDTDGMVSITGGIGIGIVTAPGLDQPVGSHAINSVPRKMIECEVRSVAQIAGYEGGLNVEISAPAGVELAEKTFNPKLGIKGGISIIGTSGIVEPMSTKALLDTIRLQLNQRREYGYDHAVITPGNYGRELILNRYGYDIDKSIKCSNYIGDTLDMAVKLGFKRLLLVGHIGKLIKVAGGIMNTHSKEADCRMEILTSVSLLKGADTGLCKEIMACVTTEEAIRLIYEAGILDPVMREVTDRIIYHLNDRINRMVSDEAGAGISDVMSVDAVLYNYTYGILGESKGAEEWFTLLAQEQEPQI